MLIVMGDSQEDYLGDMADPQEGYLDDIFDVLDAHAPMHRDGPCWFTVDGCGSVAERCECQRPQISYCRLMETSTSIS
jgi:hypothetical protein